MSKFNVGDRVRFVAADCTGDGKARQGDVGVVVSIDPGAGTPFLEVKTDRGVTLAAYYHRFELEPKAQEATFFAVGDTVQVICKDAAHAWGRVKRYDLGVVSEISKYDTIYVDFPTHKGWTADACELILVSRAGVAPEQVSTQDTIISKLDDKIAEQIQLVRDAKEAYREAQRKLSKTQAAKAFVITL